MKLIAVNKEIAVHQAELAMLLGAAIVESVYFVFDVESAAYGGGSGGGSESMGGTLTVSGPYSGTFYNEHIRKSYKVTGNVQQFATAIEGKFNQHSSSSNSIQTTHVKKIQDADNAMQTRYNVLCNIGFKFKTFEITIIECALPTDTWFFERM